MGREKDSFSELLELLPAGWEAKARELGAFERSREIKSPEGLLRLILPYLTEGKSLAGTSALTNLANDTDISKVAVFKRIQKSGAWLKWLRETVYRRAGPLMEKPPWLKDRDVILIDGSEDVTGGKTKQYFTLHYSIDLFTLSAREFLITDIKTGEKLANFKKITNRDIVIADRMYGTPSGIAYLEHYQAAYVLRIKGCGFTLYDKNRRKIDLLHEFSGLKEGEYGDIAVWYESGGTYKPSRVRASREDKDSERKGMKKLRHTNQRERGGVPVSALQEGFNKYIIVVTSLEKNISAEQILDLYRARWRIEIAFKRLKSIFRYNETPARLERTIRAWFYGKLLLAALCESLVNTGRFSPYGGEGKKDGKP